MTPQALRDLVEKLETLQLQRGLNDELGHEFIYRRFGFNTCKTLFLGLLRNAEREAPAVAMTTRYLSVREVERAEALWVVSELRRAIEGYARVTGRRPDVLLVRGLAELPAQPPAEAPAASEPTGCLCGKGWQMGKVCPVHLIPPDWVLPVRFDGTDLIDASGRLLVWEGEIGERTGHEIAQLINGRLRQPAASEPEYRSGSNNSDRPWVPPTRMFTPGLAASEKWLTHFAADDGPIICGNVDRAAEDARWINLSEAGDVTCPDCIRIMTQPAASEPVAEPSREWLLKRCAWYEAERTALVAAMVAKVEAMRRDETYAAAPGEMRRKEKIVWNRALDAVLRALQEK